MFKVWEASGSTSPGARQATKAAGEQLDVLERRRKDERLAYDAYRRKELSFIFEALVADEKHEIESLARNRAAKFGISPEGPMFRATKFRVLSERFGYRIKNIEDWKAAA
jgi:hypothetical protein